jgi:hypothetical protein
MSSYAVLAHVHEDLHAATLKRCPGLKPTYAAQQSIPT